ncbi:MAG: HEPN domain-containing protein [Planctomycetota bacterium]
MPNRWKDWLAQAKRDLNHAIHACEDEDFEWSCFSAQQGAEKAVKAVFLHLHGESWGHSVFALLKALSDKIEVSERLIEAAKNLDKHYIPTRYPNGFDSGMPGEYYTRKDAQEAIENAREIIEFCEGCVR